MSKFKVEFETNGAAFEADYFATQEVRRILAKVADKVEQYQNDGYDLSGKVMDSNGNTVGTWEWS